MFCISLAGSAQTWKNDSVILQPKYKLQVFYNLSTGHQDTVDMHSWDLAFRPGMMTDGIFVNSAAGSRVFRVSNDTNDWATSWDTASYSTKYTELFNTDTSWDVGAFNRESSGFPDFSWGKYDPVSKIVSGNRLYLVVGNAPPGMPAPMVKVWIVEKNYGNWKVRLGSLDNSMDTTITIKSSDYANSNFAYLWFNGMQVWNREPNKTDWDVLFTRYYGLQQGGAYYPVVGALTNIGVVTAKVDGVDPDQASWATYSAQTATAINTIGSDWKTFNMGTNAFDIAPDRSYFVKSKAGVIYQIKFTGFGGGATGQINFAIQNLANGITQPQSVMNGLAVYPNPISDQTRIVASFTQPVTNLLITVTDLQGRICYTATQNTQAGMQTIALPSMDLASGCYLLQLSNGNDKSVVKILVP